ncbi:MAG: hypothetical protein KDG54_12255 [Geminicoccaceae bacterium]|nr:hypothetical protein [Geminicoccaceae bacterium]
MPGNARRLVAIGLVLVPPLAIAGCNSGQSGQQASFSCPSAHIVNGLDRQTFDDGSHLTIGNINGRCSLEDDGMLLRFAVDLTIDGAAGAAAGDRPASYFVVLVDEDGEPIDKTVIDTTLPLVPGERRTIRESIEQQVSDVGASSAPAWQVFIGLQLDSSEALKQRQL